MASSKDLIKKITGATHNKSMTHRKTDKKLLK